MTLQWKNLTDVTLTGSPRQTSPAVRRAASTHTLMRCEEQGTVSVALLSKKTQIPDFNLDKTSDKPKLRDIPEVKATVSGTAKRFIWII